MVFFDSSSDWCALLLKKVHSVSAAPEPLAIWHKKLEGLSVLMSSEFFSLECSECNFCKKLHSLSVAPEPLVFWYKKLEGQKIKNVLFYGGYLQPPSLLRVLFCWEEAGRRFLICTPLVFVVCWSWFGGNYIRVLVQNVVISLFITQDLLYPL